MANFIDYTFVLKNFSSYMVCYMLYPLRNFHSQEQKCHCITNQSPASIKFHENADILWKLANSTARLKILHSAENRGPNDHHINGTNLQIYNTHRFNGHFPGKPGLARSHLFLFFHNRKRDFNSDVL